MIHLFISRNYYDVYVSTLEREEISEVDDVFNEKLPIENVHFSKNFYKTPKNSQEETDGEANSCYYSASASHTDNYCSTDEHENLFHNTIAIHSSDSGADISDQNYEKKIPKDNMDDENQHEFLPKIGKSDEAEGGGEHPITKRNRRERNNSLPDITVRDELQLSWDKYWSKNGERLIWASWIEKYSDYINPEYLEGNQQVAAAGISKTDEEGTPNLIDRTDNIFAFDASDMKIENNLEIEISSPQQIHDDWNPLSPISLNEDNTWNTYRDMNAMRNYRLTASDDNDVLVSPRCDSVTSGSLPTIGTTTTDSMTNVTRMTMSSVYDFCSSKVSSDSSSSNLSNFKLNKSCPSTYNNSLYSSTHNAHNEQELVNNSKNSSNGSLSQFNDDLTHTCTKTLVNDDNTMDVDQYWQILWYKHFQEQYALHYKQFMTTHEIINANMSTSLRMDSTYHNSVENEYDANTSGLTKNIKRKRNNKNKVDSLPKLVANLRLKNEIELFKANEILELCHDADTDNVTTNKDKKEESSSNNNADASTDHIQLEALGLPTCFGKQKRGYHSGDGGKRPPNDKPVNLKRR